MGESFTFSGVMISLAIVMIFITLAYVILLAFSRQSGEICGWELRGAWRRIAAVARTTVAEGVRVRFASGFAAVILIAVPLFWLTADGDGTVKGRIQMFITYSLGFAAFMLALLTIFFSCRSLSVEIGSRQIYAIATKPMPRWQLLVGKWLGIMLFNVTLLLVVFLGAWAGTKATVSRFKSHLARELVTYCALTEDQAAVAVAALDHVRGIGKQGADSPVIDAWAEALGLPKEKIIEWRTKLPESTRVDVRRFDEVRRQVMVARASISPPMPDLNQEIERIYGKLKTADRLPEDWSDRRIREQIEAELRGALTTIQPGMARVWKLAGPRPETGPEFIMSVRFKLQASRDLPAVTLGEMALEKDTLICGWGVGNPSKANYVERQDVFPVRTVNELEIPVNCIEEDGTIQLAFANLDPRQVDVTIDLPDDLQVLYRVGSYEQNLGRAFLAVLIPLTCLTSFGVCASTFLSLPVGSLIIVTLYILSMSMGFVAESFAATPEYVPEHPPLSYEIRRAAIGAVDWALYIGDVDPVRKLIEGRAVDWPLIWQNVWRHVLLKSTIVMAAGVMIFRRRELASVIV
jgi:hypothetical protein